ncbi:hypothetical protein MPL3356_110258 [Mesorhizobium plurifarium]|uniref:Uncharacterized protein n=1 Tax=Mesorhizobium plurifarium TaxID=69974 RepID=A0A090DA54_MESPL|nr:hypothetical protein MPL3356_110258 [Mesorhizobium plurifarium]
MNISPPSDVKLSLLVFWPTTWRGSGTRLNCCPFQNVRSGARQYPCSVLAANPLSSLLPSYSPVGQYCVRKSVVRAPGSGGPSGKRSTSSLREEGPSTSVGGFSVTPDPHLKASRSEPVRRDFGCPTCREDKENRVALLVRRLVKETEISEHQAGELVEMIGTDWASLLQRRLTIPRYRVTPMLIQQRLSNDIGSGVSYIYGVCR